MNNEQEIELTNGVLEDTPVTLGAIEDEVDLTMFGDVWKKGIFKALSWDGIFYNQLDIDPYSCTLVGSFTALSNYTWKVVPIEVMKEAFEAYKTSGKFTPWYGGLGTDGAKFALDAFNAHFGTNIKMNTCELNVQNIISALEEGSPISTWIKYGKNYLSNEQDDGILQETALTIGNQGHWITIVKLNTQEDILIKFAENYLGKFKYQIIFTDFMKMRNLFFNSCVYYSGK